MSSFQVSHARRIPAPAATVHGIFADYRVAHPAVCPPKYFRNFVVHEGGTGAGTVLTFEMVAFGRAVPTRCLVSEPEPGRLLRETYPDTGVVTDFLIEPRDDGRSCEVTLRSTFPGRSGLVGALFGGIERAMTRSFLATVYREELERVERYATSGPAALGLPPVAAPTDATRVATPARRA